MVSSAMWLLLRVKARGEDMLTLNDGLYGALGEWRDMVVPGGLTAFTADGLTVTGTQSPFIIFGPTCDSLDRVPDPWRLPTAIAEEDYILVTGAGAYSLALVTRFNGYGISKLISLETVSDHAGQCRLAG